jgi:hypothetical protein
MTPLAVEALKHPFWADAASRYRRVRWIRQENNSPHWQPDSLYLLDAAAVVQAVLDLYPSTDLSAMTDGFNVLAPGWKKCAECRCVDSELRVSDILPTSLNIDERIQFSQSAGGAPYLLGGWFQPDEQRTQSDGTAAEIVLSLSTDKPEGIVIEANALVLPSHPKQDVAIRVNGTLVTTVRPDFDTSFAKRRLLQ